jgi:hypothetical protein
MLMRFRLLMLLVAMLPATVGLGAVPSFAAERVLILSFGGEAKRITAAELLARPDAASLTVPDDVSYHRAMTYRAVPLLGSVEHRRLARVVGRPIA